MEINLEIIEKSYGFTVSIDGGIYGLTSGDMGYVHTGIELDDYSLNIWKLGVKEKDKRIELNTV